MGEDLEQVSSLCCCFGTVYMTGNTPSTCSRKLRWPSASDSHVRDLAALKLAMGARTSADSSMACVYVSGELGDEPWRGQPLQIPVRGCRVSLADCIQVRPVELIGTSNTSEVGMRHHSRSSCRFRWLGLRYYLVGKASCLRRSKESAWVLFSRSPAPAPPPRHPLVVVASSNAGTREKRIPYKRLFLRISVNQNHQSS